MTTTSRASDQTQSSSSSFSEDSKGYALVALGGGTGLTSLLRGLKHCVGGRLSDLTAVVAVSDDGGSSGRLRRDFGVLPPGDIRNCIAALADDEDLLVELFQYRFSDGEGLSGHSFGNLFLAALTGITGDFYQAILTAESILSVRGKILPATLTDLRLRARGQSGQVYFGESAIGVAGERLAALEIEPVDPPAFPPSVEAIERADMILLGPGSLYTSIGANLLIPEISEAVRGSRAKTVLPLNLMTQPGETDDLDATAHLDVVEKIAGKGLVDVVLINTADIPKDRLIAYAEEGSRPVHVDWQELETRGVEVIGFDLLADGSLVRHDPEKLSQAVLELLDADRHLPRAGGV
ncbi:MAG: uridine diphosphate-N-acetylglucosamine-binding protein YvcK [Acidobacteriota bacterium]